MQMDNQLTVGSHSPGDLSEDRRGVKAERQAPDPAVRVHNLAGKVGAEERPQAPREALETYFTRLLARDARDMAWFFGGEAVQDRRAPLPGGLRAEQLFSPGEIEGALRYLPGEGTSPLAFDRTTEALAALNAAYRAVAAERLTGQAYADAMDLLENFVGRYLDSLVGQVLEYGKYMADTGAVEACVRDGFRGALDDFQKLAGVDERSGAAPCALAADMLRRAGGTDHGALHPEGYTAADVKAMLIMDFLSFPTDDAFSGVTLRQTLGMEEALLQVVSGAHHLSPAGRAALQTAWDRTVNRAEERLADRLGEGGTEAVRTTRPGGGGIPGRPVDAGAPGRGGYGGDLRSSLRAMLRSLESAASGRGPSRLSGDARSRISLLAGDQEALPPGQGGSALEEELVKAFLVKMHYVCRHQETRVASRITGAQVDISV